MSRNFDSRLRVSTRDRTTTTTGATDSFVGTSHKCDWDINARLATLQIAAITTQSFDAWLNCFIAWLNCFNAWLSCFVVLPKAWRGQTSLMVAFTWPLRVCCLPSSLFTYNCLPRLYPTCQKRPYTWYLAAPSHQDLLDMLYKPNSAATQVVMDITIHQASAIYPYQPGRLAT